MGPLLRSRLYRNMGRICGDVVSLEGGRKIYVRIEESNPLTWSPCTFLQDMVSFLAEMVESLSLVVSKGAFNLSTVYSKTNVVSDMVSSRAYTSSSYSG